MFKKTAVYTQVTHLKLQKNKIGDITQQHIDI